MRLIKVNQNNHSIEGLTDVQVLRIYKALEAVNNKCNLFELEEMIYALKIDIDCINKTN